MEITGLIYDVHAPYHDKRALDKALNYIEGCNPNRIILAGDFCDFYKLSFWKGDPERLPLEAELKADIKLLTKIRNRFSDCEMKYIIGNHEERLPRYFAENAPAFRSIIDINGLFKFGGFDLKANDIEIIDNKERMSEGKLPYRLGKLFVLHGHEKKVSMGAVNLARLFLLYCNANVIAGHHHKTSYYMTRGIKSTHQAAWTVGTLGCLTERYQPINDWNHGFSVVYHDKKVFDVKNKIILEGRVLSS